MIIACLKYSLDNYFDLGDRILPDTRRTDGCVGSNGFPTVKGITTTSYGMVVNPTYKIFEKFLKFEIWI